MSDLTDFLTRMLDTRHISVGLDDPDDMPYVEQMLATTEGRALSALVSAALAWWMFNRPWNGEWETDHDLLDATAAIAVALEAPTDEV